MNKHNNDRSRDKIDSILYRARKNEADKILTLLRDNEVTPIAIKDVLYELR